MEGQSTSLQYEFLPGSFFVLNEAFVMRDLCTVVVVLLITGLMLADATVSFIGAKLKTNICLESTNSNLKHFNLPDDDVCTIFLSALVTNSTSGNNS
jgi:hypothetical protein